MATELAKAYVQIVPSARGIKGAIEKELGGEAQSAGASAGASIASGIKKAIAAAGIGKLIRDSLFEGAALQQSIGGIETLFKDTADVVKRNADVAFSTAGVSANEYMETVTSFAASLLQGTAGDTERAAKIADTAMIDMADNANKMGTSMASIQNAYQGFAKQNYTMLDNLKLGYGGTKEEMKRLLADAQALTGVKYDMSNLGDVYEAIHVIQGELGITGTTAKEAEETFTGSFASMKAAAKNLLGNLSLGQDIMPSLRALGKTVSTFLRGNLIPMVGNIIKGAPAILRASISAAVSAVTSFASGAPELVSSGVEAIKSFAQGFVNGIPEATRKASELRGMLIGTILQILPDAIDAGFTLIESLGQGFIDGLPVAIESIASDINNIISWLSQNTGAFIERGMAIIKNLADGILQNAPGLIASIGEAIARAAGWILEALPDFLEHGAELIGHLAQGISDALPDILDAIGGVLKSLLEKLTNGETLKKLFDAGVALLKSIVKGILSLVGSAGSYLWNNAGTIVTTIINAIRNLFKNLFEIGKDILRKIWEGIKDLTGWLTENAKNIPGWIVAGIMKVGKLLWDAARWLLEKLWEGIKNLASWIGENAKEIPGWIANGIMAVADVLLGAGKWIVDTFLGAIGGFVDTIIEFGRSIGSWIVDGIKSIGSLLYEAGSWIADQLSSDDVNQRCIEAGAAMGGAFTDSMEKATSEGMSKIINNVRDALNKLKNLKEAQEAGRGIGNNIGSGGREVLKINSPSKFFEDDIGHWIPPGVAIGVEKNMKPFLNSMEGMAELGIEAFNTEINPRFAPAKQGSAADAILALLLRYLPEIAADDKSVSAAELYAAINRMMGLAML